MLALLLWFALAGQAEDLHRLVHDGKIDEFHAKAAQLRAADPIWKDLLDVLLEAAETRKDYTLALRRAREVMKDGGDPAIRAKAAYVLGRAEAPSGHREEAIAAFRAVPDDAENSDFAVAAATALAREGEPRQLLEDSELDVGERRREKWQKNDEVFAALGLREGHWVADIGAGTGYFTLRLSPRVGPNGRVLAENISRDQAAILERRVRERALENVESILGVPDDPRLPAGKLNAVLIVNTYHEIEPYQTMLRRLHEALVPGGRLVIIDPVPRGETRKQQTGAHTLSPDFAEAELREAGFEIMDRQDRFSKAPNHWDWMLVAVR
ncbi:MAG: class I SAM-dependent methyltransferase [Bryobacteraceae bacterium]